MKTKDSKIDLSLQELDFREKLKEIMDEGRKEQPKKKPLDKTSPLDGNHEL